MVPEYNLLQKNISIIWVFVHLVAQGNWPCMCTCHKSLSGEL
jgi:hypothetical protein